MLEERGMKLVLGVGRCATSEVGSVSIGELYGTLDALSMC